MYAHSLIVMKKNIVYFFRLLRMDSDAAIRRFTSSTRINGASLRDGRFDKDRMLHAFEQIASSNISGAFPLSRIVCRMDWAAEGQSYLDDLIEFESRVNHIWEHHDDAVICTYHLGKFGGDTVIDIMRTHPMIVIGGTLHRNPFFVPPAEFLREFRERRAGRSTSASAGR